jgi:uncharacterized cupredoxin-like copper-binding protein
MRPFALLVILAVASLACAGGGTTSPPPASEQRIDVALTDALTIEPAEMSVSAGQPVIFVVTNTGAAVHEFYVGDEAAQAEHEREMADMGGMPHDEPNGIAVQPGETKELTMAFDAPGELLAGCHLPGHYPAGMRATITVTD